MPTTDEMPRSAEDLESRVDFETLIADLSSSLMNLRPGEVDGEIESALRRVCESLGIDLAVLWQWPLAGTETLVPTHFYFALEGQRSSEPMSEDLYPWSRQQLLAGRTIAVSSLAELPTDAAVDRETCRAYGIKSALCLPLVLAGESPIGGLGLNTLMAERDWSEALVQRLRLVAQVFTNALARGRREQQLQESERRLTAAAELARLAFYEVDFDSGTMYADERLRELLGIGPERDGGLHALEFWKEHLHPADRSSVLSLREQLHSGQLEQISIEYRLLQPTHAEKWIHHLAKVATRDATGRTVKSYGVLRDITESRLATEALGDLSRRLIQAHEAERALLARELHDDVSQRLAVLAIEIGRAELVASDESQVGVLRSAGAQLARLSEDIHSLAYQLHPSVLEELGLAEAMRAECERWAGRGELDVSLDADPSCVAVAKDAALCLFRVAQEAIHNVVHHAGARTASITLQPMDGGVLLTIRDDGVGFDVAGTRTHRSLGLESMRERVRLVDGTLTIESAPGLGTTITAWVPAGGEAR